MVRRLDLASLDERLGYFDEYTVGMKKSLYAELATPVSRDPNPGTIRTAAVETIDNDYIQELNQLLTASLRVTARQSDSSDEPGPSPRPRPGTTLTFTTETADEHGELELLLLE
jgi:hypothetical protein